MDSVFREAENEIAGVLRQFEGRPQAAYLRLLLLALEREQIVSVAFRQSVISERLRRMSIPGEVRRLIEHAIVWVWKDEEMHAVYARGALMQLGRGTVKLRAMMEQTAGAVGGWASGVLHHSTWRSAPVARSLANLFTFAGKLGGRVPHEVGKLLRYGPFRDFCQLNAELERASALCWDVLLKAAAEAPDARPETLIEFRRVFEDEERHRLVFDAIAESLTDNDELESRESVETLTKKIGAVGNCFLPRHLRLTEGAERPIGAGGRVWSFQGEKEEAAPHALRRLLSECDLVERIHARSAELSKPLGQMQVTVKGCFMLGYHRADLSPIVAPPLVEELARFFRDLGIGRVILAEARYVYDRFYDKRGVIDVARYFGFESPLYELADLTTDTRPHAYVRGLGAATSVGRAWAEADFRVSFGKLRSHPVVQASLSLGNLEGVGGRTDDFIFADRVADPATPLMALLDEYPPHYVLLDGYDAAPDGLAGMMGCRRPRAPQRFYAGADPFAVDCVAARHLGVNDPEDSALLRAASHWFGGWPQDVQVVGTDEPVKGWRGPQANDFRALLSLMAMPVYVWGSGRGSLFVPAMDTAAFPEKKPAGFFTRNARCMVRGLLGLPSLGQR